MNTSRRLTAMVLVAGVSACTDPGRLPTETDAAAVSASASATLNVACGANHLIAAIEAANNAAEPTTLNLASGCTYGVTGPNNIGPETGINGLPVITANLTINGNNSIVERVPGSDFRLFYVLNGNLVVSNLTMRGGSYSNSGGALFLDGGSARLTGVVIEDNHSGDDGGAVHNRAGALSIVGSIIRNNTASDHGGGVSNQLGVVEIQESAIQGNHSSDQGGGLANHFGTMIVSSNTVVEGNDAGDSGGVFNEGGALFISNSFVRNNTASDHGAGVRNLGPGTATISFSEITGNNASDSGGGLSNSGLSMLVINSTIWGNHASDSGAGISNLDGGILTIITSTISANDADESGGGLHNVGGGVTITGSTLSGNSAKFGGGLSSESGDDVVDNGVDTDRGLVSLLNTTISGNSASEAGGGIFADKGTQLTVRFSTITNNTAAVKGGGGVLLYNDEFAQTHFQGTILAGNSPQDVAAAERKSSTCCSAGYNLIGRVDGTYINLSQDFRQTGDQTNVTNPGLAALANNGGPTFTHALLGGSPALDAGGNSGPALDQRDVSRPASLLDIGAFEVVSGASFASAPTITFAQPAASPQPVFATFSAVVSPGAATLAATGACSAVGLQVTMDSPTGFCILTASLAGAVPVVRVITATKAAQTIVFTTSPPVSPVSGGTYAPAATGGASGNPVTFGATGSCAVSNGVVTLAAGTCTVTANQEGNDNFFAAPPVQQVFAVAAPAGIAFQSRSNGQNNGSATTLGIGRPSGIATGDFLLAQITFEKGSDVSVNAPAGWTLVRRTNQGSDIGQAIFRKVATASEPTSYTWSFSQSVKAAGGILRYTGVNTVVTSSGATGSSSNLTAPSVGTEANAMVVAFYGIKKKEVTLGLPAGMTGRYSFENPNDITIRAADQLPAVAGNKTATATLNGSTVSEKWVAQLVLLRAN